MVFPQKHQFPLTALSLRNIIVKVNSVRAGFTFLDAKLICSYQSKTTKYIQTRERSDCGSLNLDYCFRNPITHSQNAYS